MTNKPFQLVISLDTYAWMFNIIGLISRTPQDFVIMIVTDDSNSPIASLKKLHKDVVYLQRIYDIKKIARLLGIPKIINLKHIPTKIDLHKLVAEIQLQVLLGGISNIIYQKSYFLDEIIKNIYYKNEYVTNISSYTSSSIPFTMHDVGDIEVKLTGFEISRKDCIIKSLVGLPQEYMNINFLDVEFLNKEV